MTDCITNGGVTVTAQPSSELLLLVGRMDGKLDVLVTSAAKLDARVAALEAWRHKVAGIALAAGSVAGGAASQLPKLIALLGH